MSRPSRRTRHEEHEEHENHERWLVSYADMITVLMALFIVLFAMSTVDQTKFEALRTSLASGFGNPVRVLAGSTSPVPGDAAADGPLELGSPMRPLASEQVAQQVAQAVDAARARDALAAADRTRANVEREVRSLEQTRKAIIAALRKHRLEKSVLFRYDARGLVVSVVTDEVLFASDRAELSPVGRTVLDAIGPVLRELPNDLLVEGHTNTVPVAPKYYPSEWELSSARATTVVRHLIAADGVAPDRLGATGYADQHPLIPGTGTRANRLNRRVEIVVASTLAPPDRALLASVAATIPVAG
jgi:chemotaxis protein MotB